MNILQQSEQLGKFQNTDKEVVILGAGITGLTVSFLLQEKNIDFCTLESKNRTGGSIYTVKKDGFILEKGPNTVLLNNEETVKLLKKTGLLNKLIFANPDASKKRYIIKDDVLYKVPTSPFDFFLSPLLSLKAKLKLIKEPFINSVYEKEQSIKDFVTKRLGKEVYENFISPFVSGIYAGDADKLSIKYALPLLYEAEQKGSIFKGMMLKAKENKKWQKKYKKSYPLIQSKSKMFSFKNGLSTLTETLENFSKKNIFLNAQVYQIDFFNDRYKIYYVLNGKKKTITTKNVISTLPAYILAKIIDSRDVELSNLLKSIDYVPLAVYNIAFMKKDINMDLNSFGALVKKPEKEPFLGILFSSRFFSHLANKDIDLFTIMIGGAKQRDLFLNVNEDILKEYVKEKIKKIFNIKSNAVFEDFLLWQKAIPQYDIKYYKIYQKIKHFEKNNKGFLISGSFYKGISVTDCIKKSFELIEKIEI